MATSFFSGAFFGGEFFNSGVTPPVVQPEQLSLGGSKPKRKVRGPYSDPRIFEEYVKRCIAEREAPRVNVEAAILKEALIAEVERRDTGAEVAALINENQILKRLVALETTKRDVQAILARQRQIERQIEEMEEEEIRNILVLFDEM